MTFYVSDRGKQSNSKHPKLHGEAESVKMRGLTSIKVGRKGTRPLLEPGQCKEGNGRSNEGR